MEKFLRDFSKSLAAFAARSKALESKEYSDLVPPGWPSGPLDPSSPPGGGFEMPKIEGT